MAEGNDNNPREFDDKARCISTYYGGARPRSYQQNRPPRSEETANYPTTSSNPIIVQRRKVMQWNDAGIWVIQPNGGVGFNFYTAPMNRTRFEEAILNGEITVLDEAEKKLRKERRELNLANALPNTSSARADRERSNATLPPFKAPYPPKKIVGTDPKGVLFTDAKGYSCYDFYPEGVTQERFEKEFDFRKYVIDVTKNVESSSAQAEEETLKEKEKVLRIKSLMAEKSNSENETGLTQSTSARAEIKIKEAPSAIEKVSGAWPKPIPPTEGSNRSKITMIAEQYIGDPREARLAAYGDHIKEIRKNQDVAKTPIAMDILKEVKCPLCMGDGAIGALSGGVGKLIPCTNCEGTRKRPKSQAWKPELRQSYINIGKVESKRLSLCRVCLLLINDAKEAGSNVDPQDIRKQRIWSETNPAQAEGTTTRSVEFSTTPLPVDNWPICNCITPPSRKLQEMASKWTAAFNRGEPCNLPIDSANLGTEFAEGLEVEPQLRSAGFVRREFEKFLNKAALVDGNDSLMVSSREDNLKTLMDNYQITVAWDLLDTIQILPSAKLDAELYTKLVKKMREIKMNLLTHSDLPLLKRIVVWKNAISKIRSLSFNTNLEEALEEMDRLEKGKELLCGPLVEVLHDEEEMDTDRNLLDITLQPELEDLAVLTPMEEKQILPRPLNELFDTAQAVENNLPPRKKISLASLTSEGSPLPIKWRDDSGKTTPEAESSADNLDSPARADKAMELIIPETPLMEESLFNSSEVNELVSASFPVGTQIFPDSLISEFNNSARADLDFPMRTHEELDYESPIEDDEGKHNQQE